MAPALATAPASLAASLPARQPLPRAAPRRTDRRPARARPPASPARKAEPRRARRNSSPTAAAAVGTSVAPARRTCQLADPARGPAADPDRGHPAHAASASPVGGSSSTVNESGPSRPQTARARAAIGARALSRISSNSSAGSDCITIAPPAPIVVAPGAHHDRADHDREVDDAVEPEVADRARVDAAGDALDVVDDAHRAQLRRAGHRAAGEAGAHAFDRGARRFERAGDSRDHLVDCRVGLDDHQLGHGDGVQRADAAEVVAQEVDDHQVLGEGLLVVLQLGAQRLVAAGILGAPRGALDRASLHDPVAVDRQEALGRGAQHRQRRRASGRRRTARGWSGAACGRARTAAGLAAVEIWSVRQTSYDSPAASSAWQRRMSARYCSAAAPAAEAHRTPG